jgi:hypothetical protein
VDISIQNNVPSKELDIARFFAPLFQQASDALTAIVLSQLLAAGLQPNMGQPGNVLLSIGPWTKFFSKAVIWGLATVAAGAIAGGPAGFGVAFALFLAGADASMWSDVVEIMPSSPHPSGGGGGGGAPGNGGSDGSDGGTGSDPPTKKPQDVTK